MNYALLLRNFLATIYALFQPFFWPEKWRPPFFPHLEGSLVGLDGDLLGDTLLQEEKMELFFLLK